MKIKESGDVDFMDLTCFKKEMEMKHEDTQQ